MHRLIALDHFYPAIRKGHESARRDQGFYCLFVAIEWITEFARDTGWIVMMPPLIAAPFARRRRLRPA